MIHTAEATTALELPQTEAFALLTAYDRFQEWFPPISHSRILASEGDIVIAEFLCPRWSDEALVLELIHTPPSSAIFSQADRYRQKGFSGRWDLSPTVGDSRCLTLRVRVQLPLGLFDLPGRWQLQTALGSMLDTLRSQTTPTAGPDGRVSGGGRRKLLEVVRRPAGIEVWLGGETFELSSGTGSQQR